MLQDDLQQQTIALSIQTASLTLDVLRAAINQFLSSQDELKHGQMTMRELLEHNTGISNIEVTDANIGRFSRVAQSYGLDFSLKKDSSVEPPKYLVFFKGRDLDVINSAFQEFTNLQLGTVKPSIREQLFQLRDEIARNARDTVREKIKELSR